MNQVIEKPSGIELMLRSMGMGPLLEAAKHLAESGVLGKIAQFADGLEELNDRLARIERRLETDTSPANVGLIEPGIREEQRPLEPNTNIGQANGSATGFAPDDGHIGDI